MDLYRRAEWRAFRHDAIRLHGGVCHRCSRGPNEGVVLQVHHKIYIGTRLPWKYRHDQCEVLCRSCHAEEHGKIKPRSGWEHFGDYDDLGSPDGECELCGTAIRYVFPIYHPKWGTMEVGEICCDNLTSTTFATEHMAAQHKLFDRRKRFVFSSRWYIDKSGSHCIVQNHMALWVVRDGAKYRLKMNGTTGRLEFDSVLEAKIKAFDLIDSDAVRAFLRKELRRTGLSSHRYR
ncbi:MAG: hypothetical protein ACJ8EE_07050 [Bradyrhizobium sp.]